MHLLHILLIDALTFMLMLLGKHPICMYPAIKPAINSNSRAILNDR